MNAVLDNRGKEFSWTSSIVVHLVLVLIFALQKTVPLPKPKILTIETIAGMITPRGEGAGVRGRGQIISDQAPISPLANAFNMDLSAIKVPVEPRPLEKKTLPLPKPKVEPPPLPEPDLAKERAASAFPEVRLRPQDENAVEGLGAGARAGTSKGAPNVKGVISGRGWRGPESWDYGKIPEETSLIIQVVVKPNGLISQVAVLRTSGIREVDEFYLAKVREMIFDPLPAGVEQVEEIGEVPIRLRYKE